MWWAGSEPSQMYLGQTSVAVWAPAIARAEVQWLSTETVHEGCARGMELLNAGERRPRRHRLAVWLSGTLARPFIFEPVRGLRKWSEAQAIAAGLAPEVTGLQGPCNVWLDDWSPGKSCIAIAHDRSVSDLLESSVRANRVWLTAVCPWWVKALNEARQTDATSTRILAVEELEALTILSGGNARFEAAASYVPRPNAGQTKALVTRALLNANALGSDGVRASMHRGNEFSEARNTRFSSAPFNVRFESVT